MATKMLKRALMAVAGLHARMPTTERLVLAPDVYLATAWPLAPVDIPPSFSRQYSPEALEPLESPIFVVWAEQEVDDKVIGAVDVELERKLGLVDIALSMVSGWGMAHRVITVELHEPDGQRSLQGITSLEPWSAREGWRRLRFDIDKVPAITSRLLKLTAEDWRERGYDYFLRGVRSFFRACHQDVVDDRYELFCRAIETVVQTGQGGGARQFAEAVLEQQGRLIPDRSHRNHAYEAHYRRRNEVVHGHRFLEEKKDRRAIALMESTARGYFQQLLSDPAFFESALASQRARVEARDSESLRRQVRAANRGQEGAPPRPARRPRSST
ncbi:hypothetical protein FJV41_16170 [Myxococcus llanfairpwllgwyngyllgogerychwyrndrobwllllantysiliogogogochensis]|uniref:Apea-like HEPN domain-containing protein n=1 Tax=Myxococcus llanfairpwllgwyngyllgogerychwyrndrobwllllantysiliogogogochensis TaxID=2590453 RepID=A0A540X0Y9_9BACT|nr:hypothetical protein [Myxococcus llanfairpwllgwyngyllgogerychwyrndrobwllllantysiliogogogochensis]TQF14922.1 hypothetical protein FJV41_16170 [Myxococcus llanfairpwllgwyngyllgogerychwyrndrobwllllantysiliogogogochensis]